MFHMLLLKAQNKFILGICLLLAIPTAPAVTAPSEYAQVRQHMQEILQQADFQTRRAVTEWRYKDSTHTNASEGAARSSSELPMDLLRRLSAETEADDEESSWDFSHFQMLHTWLVMLAQFAEILLWSALVLGLAALLWAVYRRARGSLPQRPKLPSEVADFTDFFDSPQAPPEHPAQAAWAYWQQGQARAAISLLYRASLYHLRQREGLSLPDSATEGECLRLIQRTQSSTRSQYCTRLTRTWQTLAYAHQLPTSANVQALCDAWDTEFLQIK